MIIDIVLDRKDNDKCGYPYDPSDFYRDIMGYLDGCGGSYAERITRAMDFGSEKDVKNELCRYIDDGDYNPAIKDYIRARRWLVSQEAPAAGEKTA